MMDQSYTDSDISMSPSQLLERLQVLRQLQLLQRGKLQKQSLQYQETSETSSTITEIVSHFSNSTSYNTFRSLLQSPQESLNDASPRPSIKNFSPKLMQQDLIEGVTVLNLSQEHESTTTSVSSNKTSESRTDSKNRSDPGSVKTFPKNQISLDEIPILSPKKDFEALVLEKLKDEKTPLINDKAQKSNSNNIHGKKPFLRRGEGMARFGLKKNSLVVQNTKSLPWRKNNLQIKPVKSPIPKLKLSQEKNKNTQIEIVVTEPQSRCKTPEKSVKPKQFTKTAVPQITQVKKPLETGKRNLAITEPLEEESGIIDSSNCEIHCPTKLKLELPKGPLLINKGKTWAALLTKEQDDFLRQLKQSEYYKNYASPAKSAVSDISCDENLAKLRQARELAEQNMFDLLENKASHESFTEHSFVNKFLKSNTLECTGESTPMIMQRCLMQNPKLMQIFPELQQKKSNESFCETENSEWTECCSDNCSTVSSCCSCKTLEPTDNYTPDCPKNKGGSIKNTRQKDTLAMKKNKKVDIPEDRQCQEADNKECEAMRANMAEMNAKLVATSELLKERLQELEDEIETFRKENVNLTKMREEMDAERQKFYEEKNTFEQKFNEEKILSEYYLAEEKEKLSKQKQTYERYVREMRGRLNKKDKDEVVNLKREISDLKEEIRVKDAKTTSLIARLRNQLKIMEKEKKELVDVVEKLKKENRRIQHSNDITRRLTNMKYLEEINKKLTNMSNKTKSEVDLDQDVKYKAFEIERQSRSRRVQSASNVARPRAKSVPNLKVTSRYAKYFSQRDTASEMERHGISMERVDNNYPMNDEEDVQFEMNETTSNHDDDISTDEDRENHLEKLYMDRFQSASPTSNRSSQRNTVTEIRNPDGFFLRKSASGSNRDSGSPNVNDSPPHFQTSASLLSKSAEQSFKHQSHSRRDTESNSRSKSPVSILSNRSSSNHLIPTVINQEHREKLLSVSPEPTTSKTSVTKTNLNPTEIKKPDGSRELRFPNGNIKFISADGKYSKFVYYNGDIKENFYNEGRIKYFYAEPKTYHTTHADGLEVLEFPDGQVEKRYKDGSTEIRLPNGSVRYYDPKNEHVREEWRFPDGTALTIAASGDQRVTFPNGQVEVHAKDHKRREFPDGTVKLVYNDGTSETRYASGRVRIKDKHGNLIMDSSTG